MILSRDRARQHYRSKRVRAYLERNNDDVMIVEYLPKGSPEFSAVEECCKEKRRSIGIKILSQVYNLKAAITDRLL